MPTRIPTEADFTPILSTHPSHRPGGPNPISLVYPSPPESTTAILLLFRTLTSLTTPSPLPRTHNQNQTASATPPAHSPPSQKPYATPLCFYLTRHLTHTINQLSLPGVLSISIQGTAPLPALLADPAGERQGYHWGDDIVFTSGGEIDPDPGFETARRWVMEKLIGEVLVQECGWEVGDLMLFGFGQGGAVAVGLGSLLRTCEGGLLGGNGGRAFKGVVSVGGALPASMIPSGGGGGKAKTPVLVCCGRESEAVDEDAVEVLEREFEQVKVVRWARGDDGMPRSREEVLPMMQFFAERLRSGWL